MSRLYLEVADDDRKRSMGLMYRGRLSANAGMIFDFGRKIPLSFWMKDTKIPLDIAFLDDDFKIAEIKDMVPYSTKSVRSLGKYRYALEVNSGWFDKNDIGVGSKLCSAKQISVQEELPPTVSPEPSIIPDSQPTSQKPPPVPERTQPKPEVAVNLSFRDSVKVANTNNLAIAFQYEFPEGNINSYVLLPQDGYDIKQGRSGELVCGRCVHSGGEYRNFIIDNIIDFDLYYHQGENAGVRVETPPPAIVNPDPTLVVAKGLPAVKISLDDLGMIKESQSYSTSGQLMMTEYWDDIKSRKGKGKTEGQAILDYLSENSKRNSPKKKTRKKKKKK